MSEQDLICPGEFAGNHPVRTDFCGYGVHPFFQYHPADRDFVFISVSDLNDAESKNRDQTQFLTYVRRDGLYRKCYCSNQWKTLFTICSGCMDFQCIFLFSHSGGNICNLLSGGKCTEIQYEVEFPKGKDTMDGYKKAVYCYDCGKDITNDYKIGTDHGMICVDCLYNDTVCTEKAYRSFLGSTSSLTIAGMLLAEIVNVISKVPAVSQTTEKVSWTVAMILSIGFFFGVKTIFKWVSKWPVIITIFSIFFCILFLGIFLQIAAGLGWIIMIKDWWKVKRMRKEYRDSMDFMAKVLSDMRKHTYQNLENRLKKWI